MIEILWATVIIGGTGLLFGVILSVASMYLSVEEDPRIDQVEKMLPGYNCGACGTPGCRAFATEIVSGRAGSIKRCKPGKVDVHFNPILEYLKEHPNQDGSPVEIKL